MEKTNEAVLIYDDFKDHFSQETQKALGNKIKEITDPNGRVIFLGSIIKKGEDITPFVKKIANSLNKISEEENLLGSLVDLVLVKGKNIDFEILISYPLIKKDAVDEVMKNNKDLKITTDDLKKVSE